MYTYETLEGEYNWKKLRMRIFKKKILLSNKSRMNKRRRRESPGDDISQLNHIPLDLASLGDTLKTSCKIACEISLCIQAVVFFYNSPEFYPLVHVSVHFTITYSYGGPCHQKRKNMYYLFFPTHQNPNGRLILHSTVTK